MNRLEPVLNNLRLQWASVLGATRGGTSKRAVCCAPGAFSPTSVAALVDLPTLLVFIFFELTTHTHTHILFPSANTSRYTGVFDCALQTAREGGVAAFYKGFTSNFARLGAFNVALFLALEQARAALR